MGDTGTKGVVPRLGVSGLRKVDSGVPVMAKGGPGLVAGVPVGPGWCTLVLRLCFSW